MQALLALLPIIGIVRPLGLPSRCADISCTALSSVRAPRAAAAPLMQLMGDASEDAGRPDDEDAGVADFRAKLMRQMMGKGEGGAGSTGSGLSDRERLMRSVETASLADSPASGVLLIADPARFCSRNPFARPVKDLNRFGLDGPVAPDEMPPDLAAQMLPVVLLLEHGPKGSFGVLLERRTGALMGDIDIESYGCVAISPLWLGGSSRQNSLSVIHSCKGIDGAKQLRDGMHLGGWEAARPRVADSSLAASRFKFYLGGTAWGPGQLDDEIKAGAWIQVEASPELVLKERLDGSGSRRAKPVWAELLQTLGEPGEKAYHKIYGREDKA